MIIEDRIGAIVCPDGVSTTLFRAHFFVLVVAIEDSRRTVYSQSDKLFRLPDPGFPMVMISKEILPPGFSTEAKEQGLKARFYANGHLAEYGYFWEGGTPACGWILHMGNNDATATVQRRRKYVFPEDEAERFDPENADEVEKAWTEWLEGWLDSIIEKAHTPMTCSFCNKGKEEVDRLIAGPVAMICDQCVGFCRELIGDDVQSDSKENEEANQR